MPTPRGVSDMHRRGVNDADSDDMDRDDLVVVVVVVRKRVEEDDDKVVGTTKASAERAMAEAISAANAIGAYLEYMLMLCVVPSRMNVAGCDDALLVVTPATLLTLLRPSFLC